MTAHPVIFIQHRTSYYNMRMYCFLTVGNFFKKAKTYA